MGNTKTKPKKVTKMQVQIACLKVKAHLELVKQRKVNQVMKDQKLLINLLNANVRNKNEELLQAQKVISDLKYIQVCTTLISYANNLRGNSMLIAQSEGNAVKLAELLPYIFSIVYAAQNLGLSSLTEFKQLMMNFFGQENATAAMQYVDSKVIDAFKVKQSPLEINTYFIQMGQRNNIPLEKINKIGHNFSNQPIVQQPIKNNTNINTNTNIDTHNQNQNPINSNPNQYPYNPYNQYNPNNPNPYNNQQPNIPNNPYNNNPYVNNPYSNPNNYNPYNNPNNTPYNNPINPYGNINPNNYPNQTPYQSNMYPDSNYPMVKKNQQKIPAKFQPAKFKDPYQNIQINNLQDIPLYPQIDRMSFDIKKDVKVNQTSDQDFDRICNQIKKGL